MVQRRRAYSWSPLFTLFIVLIVGVAAGLIGLVIWSQIAVRSSAKLMIGPGTFTDAQDRAKFDVPAGWEVVHDGAQTRVQRTDGSLPSYEVELKSIQEINLVVNWNCATLPQYVPGMVKGIVPWDATITYTSVPCAQRSDSAVYVHAYLSLNDGSQRIAVLAFAPLDGVTWIVARTDPFTGQSSADLIGAMNTTVTSARR
jgi:hypothetical protein